MISNLLALAGFAAVMVQGGAPSVSCRVESASPPGQWKFVRAYDPKTGQIVFQQALNGGDSRPITVTGESVKIESKLPGHTVYESGPVVTCKDGNVVKA